MVQSIYAASAWRLRSTDTSVRTRLLARSMRGGTRLQPPGLVAALACPWSAVSAGSGCAAAFPLPAAGETAPPAPAPARMQPDPILRMSIHTRTTLHSHFFERWRDRPQHSLHPACTGPTFAGAAHVRGIHKVGLGTVHNADEANFTVAHTPWCTCPCRRPGAAAPSTSLLQVVHPPRQGRPHPLR